ncbi:MAG: NAD(P)H-dependent oxidoreductase [Geminicoccaceae bacterium]
MRVLLIFCHPVETSYNAALHRAARTALERAGHEVDDLDLYAERFDPVLSREERLCYHDLAVNRRPVEPYVERLLGAEALVLCFPVWSYGPPAMLKGFFDRVFVPGVSFSLEDGRVRPGLTRIKKLAAIVSYGQPRWLAWLAGDPPRKLMTRWLRLSTGRATRVSYLAHYDMNRSTDASRKQFLAKVRRAMAAF